MSDPVAVLDELYQAVRRECERTHVKYGAAHSMLGPDMAPGERLAVLVEEVGEVAQESLGMYDSSEQGTIQGLADELLQVAAMSLGWLASLYTHQHVRPKQLHQGATDRIRRGW